MSAHPSAEEIAAFAAGLLEERESENLEAHLFSCGDCALEAEKLFALGAAVHRAVPPVLSVDQYEELSQQGRIAAENPISPGQVSEVRYPEGHSLLVHRLGVSDLTRARRVDVSLFNLEGGLLVRYDDVPFDAEHGEVLVACQSHFADFFPHDIDFRVEVVIDDQRKNENRYTILHRA
jgi:hypothetical protein